MLDIQFDNEDMQQLQDIFNDLLPSSLYMSHYELNEMAEDYTPQHWKEFLTIPSVSDYISQEVRLMQATEMRKLLRDVSTKSKSVGTAQLLTSLTKALETQAIKDGPIFIYCYVPPNPNEIYSGQVKITKRDPFIIDG